MTYGLSSRIADAGRKEQAAGALVVLALLAVPWATTAGTTRLLITVILFAVFSTAYNLLYGYTGLLSFGHAMFVGVAAFTAAKVFRSVGTNDAFQSTFGGASVLVTFLVALVLATLVAMLIGVVIGWFCVRREEIYFALLTLSFSMAIWAILQQNISGQLGSYVGLGGILSSGGSDGLPVSFRALGEVDLGVVQFTFVDITNYLSYYYVVLVVSVVLMYAMWRIIKSPFGTICKAIRENPGRAEAIGVDRTFHSWITFIISGTVSGTVGAMLVPLNGGALPDLAHWTYSALPVIMTVIGGPYAFFGPAVGSFVFEVARDLISVVGADRRWQLIFGVVLLVVVLFFERGVAGGLDDFRLRYLSDEDTDEAESVEEPNAD